DMCTYGTIMSVLIPTMIGKHHLKLDMPGEFSNKVLQKCLTTTRCCSKRFTEAYCHDRRTADPLDELYPGG
ncbi:hypothetical protein, partial [Blautia hansenii]|uniref:hypothetical protein n=1 Tax=Blautia hansenii TaxID=1322 RepID=UPI003BA89698